MPRPLREDAPGMLHHVGERGLARRSLMETGEEARYFLDRLEGQHEKGRILVRAFVLMTNHFHLFVESLIGELSAAMREVLGGHTRAFNRSRPGRDGTLYPQRFWSEPVRTVGHRRCLLPYIHTHPLKSRITGAEANYPFCSAWYLIRDEPPPEWMDLTWSGRPPGGPTVQPERLPPPARRFIEERIRHPDRGADPLDDLLGSAPLHVQRWLAERAQLADQTRPAMPVADGQSVLGVLQDACAEQGLWICNPSGKRARDAWAIIAAGLLRDVAGMTFVRIGKALGCAGSAVAMRYRAHAQCMAEDPLYAARAGEFASCALDRCHGPAVRAGAHE